MADSPTFAPHGPPSDPARPSPMNHPSNSRCRAGRLLSLLAMAIVAMPAQSQTAPEGWGSCAALTQDAAARLACFDRWAAAQAGASSSSVAATPPAASVANSNPAAPASPAATPTAALAAAPAARRDCDNPELSTLSRYWELEEASDCGTFGIRGYRPISLSWARSSSVNTTPTSPSPGHTGTYTPYSQSEMRVQLSIRTKIASGLLTGSEGSRRDSLWFGYTQQSQWQLFNGHISRPFRSTDHEPEIIYIHPFDTALPGGWNLRYLGLSAAHQSNGQSLPLSRSWNRGILMAGFEKGRDFTLTARAWQRLRESPSKDDNPDMADHIGRAELAGFWQKDAKNTFGLTVRHSLRRDAHGSVRLEWLRALGGGRSGDEPSGLRLHTQIFSGYGDSLLDYNQRRTVFSIGLSLVDF